MRRAIVLGKIEKSKDVIGGLVKDKHQSSGDGFQPKNETPTPLDNWPPDLRNYIIAGRGGSENILPLGRQLLH